MLDIVSNCNPVQYQGKLMMQTWENGEKLKFGPNFAPSPTPLPKYFPVSFTYTSS